MKIDKDDFPRYARTDDGIKRIAKYMYNIEYENCYSLWFENENCGLRFSDNDLPKMSKNIIDLIEVGDYVNGHKVFDDMRVDTDDYGNDFIEIGIEIDNMLNHYIREEDIKSIVTKEQFEKMEFRLEK